MIEVIPTTVDDPRVQAIVDAGGLPTPVDRAHVNTVILGLEDGTPYAFAGGFLWGALPVLEHFAVRPGFVTYRRMRRIADAYAQTLFDQGEPLLVTSVRHANPHARPLRALLRSWPAERYADDGTRDWWVHYREETRS